MIRDVRAALKRVGLTPLSFELTAALKWKLVGSTSGRVFTREEADAELTETVVTMPVEEYTLVAQVKELDATVLKLARTIDVGHGAVPILMQAQSFNTFAAYTEICCTAVRNGDQQ